MSRAGNAFTPNRAGVGGAFSGQRRSVPHYPLGLTLNVARLRAFSDAEVDRELSVGYKLYVYGIYQKQRGEAHEQANGRSARSLRPAESPRRGSLPHPGTRPGAPATLPASSRDGLRESGEVREGEMSLPEGGASQALDALPTGRRSDGSLQGSSGEARGVAEADGGVAGVSESGRGDEEEPEGDDPSGGELGDPERGPDRERRKAGRWRR